MMSKRPSSVTTLLWLVLIFTVWNVIRLGAAILDWNLLLEFAPRPGPFYIAGSAAFWTLSGIALWLALRWRCPHARLTAAIFSAGYAAWWWGDRLFLQQPRPNILFTAFATLILLAFNAFLLFQPRTKEYFRQRERHEQTTSDQNPA